MEATDVAGRTVSKSCTVNVDLPSPFVAEDCAAKFPPAGPVPRTFTLASSDAPGTDTHSRKTEYFRLRDLGELNGLLPPKYAGCNGLDDNSDIDQQIDECDEDVYGAWREL